MELTKIDNETLAMTTVRKFDRQKLEQEKISLTDRLAEIDEMLGVLNEKS